MFNTSIKIDEAREFTEGKGLGGGGYYVSKFGSGVCASYRLHKHNKIFCFFNRL